MSEIVWRPGADQIMNSNLTAYQGFLRQKYGLSFPNYTELYKWSVRDIYTFWESIWKYSSIIRSQPYESVVIGPSMFASRWFTGAKLNFAENLLRNRDNQTAIVHWNESGARGKITHAELYRKVANCAAGLKLAGVVKGDRVAAYVTNIPEAVIMMLATTSLGAIWSSCSPDFGLQGVLDRFRQIEPKVLLAVEGYQYQGKHIDRSDVVAHLIESLPSLREVVMVNRETIDSKSGGARITDWGEFTKRETEELEFVQSDFDHPVYILYSSGTTGAPKCIVHGAGGTLLQHYKEHALHCDLKSGEVISYFTTCGWMMWNWLVSALQQGAAIFLYDGSPAYPDMNILWDAIDAERINVFGTSPRFLQASETADLIRRSTHNLETLRLILSTGSPLPDNSYDWVYNRVKTDVQLASISGGTDIVSCFMLGCPTIPVYRGKIQTRGLGMKVETFSESGQPIEGEVGELVCTAPFPSRPVKFWNDPDCEKYRTAYFDHFPGVWRHGDFIKITESGGVIVYGRSDATLNRAGVRIGTAEIYGPVEAMREIDDSIVVERRIDGKSEIVLFVVLAAAFKLSSELESRIKNEIRTQATPRHVPDRIIPIKDVPRTVSGKKVEIAVSRILNSQPVTNREALQNPDSLHQFEQVRDSLLSLKP